MSIWYHILELKKFVCVGFARECKQVRERKRTRVKTSLCMNVNTNTFGFGFGAKFWLQTQTTKPIDYLKFFTKKRTQLETKVLQGDTYKIKISIFSFLAVWCARGGNLLFLIRNFMDYFSRRYFHTHYIVINPINYRLIN